MSKLLVALCLASSLVLVPTSVEAQTRHTTDPAGDGLKGRALDITDVELSNRDHAVVTTISVVHIAHGDLGVRLQERHGRKPRPLAAVLSYHFAGGDKNHFASLPRRRSCDGLSVTWDGDADQIRIRIPSRCIRHGDYGALRAQAITEIGSDADIAPKDPQGDWRWSRWASRG